MLAKYKLLFEFLKKKVGSDPARMIVYNVFNDDNDKPCLDLMDKLAQIYEKWGNRRYGSKCSSLFIYKSFMIHQQKQNLHFTYHNISMCFYELQLKCLEYDDERLQRFLTSKKHMKRYGYLLDKYGDDLFRKG